MEKVYRKPAVKTSPMHLFNFGNSPKQPTHVWDFRNKLFLKEIMKKVTWFFLLHPVTFYGQNFEKQKCLELVISHFELQDMLTKIPFLVLPFESGNWNEKEKNNKRLNKWREKTFFKIFKMLSFGKIWKIEETSVHKRTHLNTPIHIKVDLV